MAILTPGLALLAQSPATRGGIEFWSPVAPNGDSIADGPTFLSNPWDYAVFNGQQLPGRWTVHGLPTLAIDKKHHAGTDGLVITANGYIPGPVELEGLIWTSDQWAEMQRLASQIWRRPVKDPVKGFPVALTATIEHPALAFWGIAKVVVVGVSPPEPGPIKQTMVIKIKCIEFVPVNTKTRTQTAGRPSPTVVLGLQPKTPLGLQTPQLRPPDQTDAGLHGPPVNHVGGAQ